MTPPAWPAPGGGDAPAPPCAQLRVKSSFSFLRGASHPDELMERAARLGLHAIALTDIHTLAGVVRAHIAAKESPVKLVIGAEIIPAGAPPLILHAPDRRAYAALSRLISRGCRAAEKGGFRLRFEDVVAGDAGLLATTLPGPPEHLARVREAFGDRASLAAELLLGPDDTACLHALRALSRQTGLPLVAMNDVHYHDPCRRRLQDVLVCIREGVTLREAGRHLFPNGERHLKGPAAMAAVFRDAPEALRRAVEIADRCAFSLDELRYEYPEEVAPGGAPPVEHLRRLVWIGAAARYPGGVPERVRRLLEHELDLIARLRYEAYFLTVHDIVGFARERGILCQGRGSAANSAVCYCLGITAVDPARIDVLFERFISAERNEPPDIDVDFEHERREEVFRHIYERFGRDRAGIVAETICWRGRSAARAVGKALGLSLDQVDRLAKTGDWSGEGLADAARAREAGLDPSDRTVAITLELVREIEGFPRHLSQHVGGFVITRGPLHDIVPIENAAMEGRTVIEWNKDDIDALGILKIDCLALGMLTAIRRAFGLIAATHGRELTLATIPPEDPAVYDMVSRADTTGVFQIESRAQMAMLPRLRPRCFYDLVIEVAIVRPGPIQGGMVHPYLRRRSGREEVTYPSPSVRAVLEKTLGVPLFQEQAMRLAVVAAGFTPGEADRLRRAMGAWRRPGIIDVFREKLIAGMTARGYAADFAAAVFEQLRGFGEYGFPESHAASFALLVYVSAWLKLHHPDAFTAALLNSQPMGFYAPAQLVRDARAHGVEVRPVDVMASGYDCTLEGPPREGLAALRLGLRMVRGLSPARVDGLLRARAAEPFRSVADVARRAELRSDELRSLAAAGAFRSLEPDRRAALWETIARGDGDAPLFADLEVAEPPPSLPPMTLGERVIHDCGIVGLSLERHPVALVRPALLRLRAARAADVARLPHRTRAAAAGLVLVRQRPATANGILFLTLEDESGILNVIVHARIYERFRAAIRGATLLLARGRVERSPEDEGGVVHLVAFRLEDRTDLLAGLPSVSRDFH